MKKYKNIWTQVRRNTRIYVFLVACSPRRRQNCRFRQSCQDSGLITSQAISICREESEWIPPCFHTEKAGGALVDPRPFLYENEGEDADASSPSHMRNYLATIDRLPAKRSAAGRWRNYLATIDRLSVLVFIFLSDKWIKYIIIINRQLSRRCKAGR